MKYFYFPSKIFSCPFAVSHPLRYPQTFLSILISFTCSRLQYKGNYIIPCFRLLSHSMMFFRIIHVVTCINSLFLFYYSVVVHFMNIPPFVSSIHLLMDIWGVFSFGLLQIELLWTFVWVSVEKCFHFSWVNIRSRIPELYGR